MNKFCSTLFCFALLCFTKQAYACSDSYYYERVKSEINSSMYGKDIAVYKAAIIRDGAKNIARISKECANSTNSSYSRNKMLKIASISEQLSQDASVYYNALSDGSGKFLKNQSKEEYGLLDMLIGVGIASYYSNEAEKSLERIENGMHSLVNELKNF